MSTLEEIEFNLDLVQVTILEGLERNNFLVSAITNDNDIIFTKLVELLSFISYDVKNKVLENFRNELSGAIRERIKLPFEEEQDDRESKDTEETNSEAVKASEKGTPEVVSKGEGNSANLKAAIARSRARIQGVRSDDTV